MLQTMSMQMPGPVEPQIMTELDIELANLLNSLSLQQKNRTVIQSEASVHTPNEHDVQMSDEETSQSDTSESSNSSAEPLLPCGLLQAITGLYEAYETADGELENFPTTGGEYLELIFTHREQFAASPHTHTGCPAAFTSLARALELRAWRADRDADIEAVNAFGHEAWMIAAWMTSGGMWWQGSGAQPKET